MEKPAPIAICTPRLVDIFFLLPDPLVSKVSFDAFERELTAAKPLFANEATRRGELADILSPSYGVGIWCTGKGRNM